MKVICHYMKIIGLDWLKLKIKPFILQFLLVKNENFEVFIFYD